MNIGIVTTWFERGAAYVSRQICSSLEERHEVFIYARGGEAYATKDPAWDGRKVTWGKRSKLPVTTAIDKRDFQRWIEKNRLDLILFNEQHWWVPLLWCNEIKIATGAYIDYYTEATLNLFGAFDFLICNTKRHLSAFQWHPQAIYIPWGTDIDLFRPKSYEPVFEGFVTFFHSAGMSPLRKGCDHVVEAFSRLNGPARLIIHSQANLDRYMPGMKDLMAQLKEAGRLIVHEKTVPAPGLYHLGDVYVYPSRLDGIGLTIAEALACGLPVITSNNPPMDEFIEETCGRLVAISRLYARSDGYYWPKCEVDRDCLVEAMQYYVDRREALGDNKRRARLKAETELNWKLNGAALPDIFANIRKRSDTDKESAFREIVAFEQERTDLQAKLYFFSPALFVSSRWIWNNIMKVRDVFTSRRSFGSKE